MLVTLPWGRSRNEKMQHSAKVGVRVSKAFAQRQPQEASHGCEKDKVLRYGVTLLWTMVWLGLVIAVLYCCRWLIHRPYFDIHHRVISGELHQVDRALVAKAARRIDGGLFTANLNQAALELRTIPWVRGVKLRRVWPDTLEILVEEQVPVAYWGDDDLLNNKGEVFPAEYLGDLPRFDGPQDSGPEMLQAWQRFNQLLQGTGHRVEELALSQRGAWVLTLEDDSHWLLGRNESDQRLARLVMAWPTLQQGGAVPAGSTVDLRYPNGFAVHMPGGTGPGKMKP